MNLIIKEIIEQATSKKNEGNFKEAERIYRNAIQISPEHVAANNRLGLLLVELFRSEEALPFFLRVLEQNKSEARFWINYINALINLERLDQAREFINRAATEGFSGEEFDKLMLRTKSPNLLWSEGKFFQARDADYLGFLRILHNKTYENYFEIGTRFGSSLALSQSPSIAIDPYFQVEKNIVGNKEFCMLFQETSNSFFTNRLSKFSDLKCELAFIDGMHHFDQALRDFINLAKISSKESLFLFHNSIPWTFRMATRNFQELDRDESWTGDIWKLVHIFIDAGMKDKIKLITSAPSGLLAVMNPEDKNISELETNFDEICKKWLDICLDENTIKNFYNTDVFQKPEGYLRYLEKISFGNELTNTHLQWISN